MGIEDRNAFIKNNEYIILAIIVALGLALRIVMLFNIKVVSPDSPTYIEMARTIKDYGLGAFFSQGYIGSFSIYPVFIHLMHLVIGDYILSAQLVSLIFGTMVFFPLYFIARRMMGVAIGLMTLFLVAVHPHLMRLAVEVLKDSTLFFFAITSVSLALVGSLDRKYLFILLAGVSTWLTVSVRLYAIILVPALLFAILVQSIVARDGLKRTLANLTLFLVPVPALILPIYFYLVGFGGDSLLMSIVTVIPSFGLQDTGYFAGLLIENNPGVNYEYLTVITDYPYLCATAEFLNVLATAFFGFFFFLFIVGLFLDRKNLVREKNRIFILSFALVFLSGDYSIVIMFFFLTKRQILPLVLVLLPWSALALKEGLSWVQGRLSSAPQGTRTTSCLIRDRAPQGHVIRNHAKGRYATGARYTRLCRVMSVWITPLVLGFWAISSFFYAGTPIYKKALYQREAGEFIKELSGEGSTILAPIADTRLILYAEGNGIFFRDEAEIPELIKTHSPDFVVWDMAQGPIPVTISFLHWSGEIVLIGEVESKRGPLYLFRIF